MHRFCLWIMMVMNRDKMVFVDGLCQTLKKDVAMICQPCTDESQLPSTDKSIVYKALSIKECYHMTLHKEQLLKDYSHIIAFFASHIPDMAFQVQKYFPLDTFSGMTELKHFFFANSNLTNKETWILPPTVQIYQVDHNNYEFLDLSMLTSLEEFSAFNNDFTKLPKFSQPYSTIKRISMYENPIEQLSLDDIVPLCFLETLNIEMQADLFDKSEKDLCRCLQLTKWIKDFNIKGSVIKCPTFPYEVNCQSNFSYYEQMRKECLKEDIVPPPAEGHQVEAARKWLIIIMAIMIGGLVITVCAITIIRNYHPHSAHDSVEHGEHDDDEKQDDSVSRESMRLDEYEGDE